MATDPLDFIVALLQSRAVRSKIVAGGGQWSIRKPRYTDPSFCVMLDGACWFHPQGGDATELREGDFLLLPETPRFVLASDPALPPMDVPIDAEGDAAYGDSAPTMRMLGGYFQFDRANAELVARLLPPVILIRRGQPGAARLGRIVELIAEEAGEHNRCRDLILERLVEVLLIEAWRFETEHASAEKGLLGDWLIQPCQEFSGHCTPIWPGRGRSRNWRARRGCHGPFSPSGSPAPSASHPCSTSPNGGLRERRNCCWTSGPRSRRLPAKWATARRAPSARRSRGWSGARRPRSPNTAIAAQDDGERSSETVHFARHGCFLE